jgi:hypothetical protein
MINAQTPYGAVDYTGACDTVRDPDCDHWYTEHDNCATTFNPNQDDQDDDGRGDVCDNCVEVKNPSQANCNLAAEEARFAAQEFGSPGAREAYIVGDACDPVPCPAGNADEVEWTDTNCVRVGDHDECTSRRRASTFRTPTVGSSQMNPPGQDPVTSVVPGVVTEFRFCKSVELPNYIVNCADPSVMKDEQLDFGEVSNNPARPWHRVRFGATTPATTRTWDYGLTRTLIRWRHEDDVAAWFASTTNGFYGIRLPDSCTTNPASCLDGVFWMHAKTNVGRAERGISDLSNRFTHVVPERGTVGYCPMLPEGIIVQDPSPEGGVGVPEWEVVLGSKARVGLAPGRMGADPRSSVLAVPMVSSVQRPRGPHWGAARRRLRRAARGRRGREPGACVYGQECHGRVRQAHDQSPLGKQRRPEWMVERARLRADRGWGWTTRMSLARRGSSAIRSTRYRSARGPLVAIAGEEGPQGVTAPLLVFSPAAGGFYALGGTQASNAQPSLDVWFHPLPGPWQHVTRFENRDAVLAATYSFADRHLWMVVAPEDVEKGYRLQRLSPVDGAHEEVYQFAYRTGAKPILTVDRDGSILLSMARATETGQARFWHDEQGYHAQRIAPLAGKLHRPIVVDDVDYASVLETASHLQAVRVKGVVRRTIQCILHPSRVSGLRRTAPTGVQLRVGPVQRRGVAFLAAT